jgi:N-dimethylarginine dimethylaminohydrolase
MTQKILMCAPDYFAVNYVINPWMQNHVGGTQLNLARTQWQNLHDKIAQLCPVVLQPAQPDLPDLVFTANAGLVYQDLAIVSHFRNTERQGEEQHDAALFRDLGFRIAEWPQDVLFEGAGDALFDREHDVLWLGFGFRSDARAATTLQALLPVEIVTLHLVDPRFYHLDTCWCPLQNGYVMYYPAAFAPESQKLITSRIPADKLIAVSEADALGFACNTVNIGHTILLNHASPDLQHKLQQAGFTVEICPLSEFMNAGGAAKCLTLKLDEPE